MADVLDIENSEEFEVDEDGERKCTNSYTFIINFIFEYFLDTYLILLYCTIWLFY